ncbi:hypothetical protein CAC42_765 [Sphaceloma murrayae]|uniref:Uncharacterized protein n=1 Tax=Sphaceloma murrayae TaxID=2082308 RepID=A0A2K1QK30_9PEZI|nr:hypothetical protein CAC42_765 [Sphaceloma murrayae]
MSPSPGYPGPGYQWPIDASVKGFVCITPPKGKWSASSRLENCCAGSLTSVTNATTPDDISYPATCVSWCLVNATSVLPPLPDGHDMPADDFFKCMNPDPSDWEVSSSGYVYAEQDRDLLCDWVNDNDAKAEWQDEYDRRISVISLAAKTMSGNWAKPTDASASSNASSPENSTSTTTTTSSRVSFTLPPNTATGSVFAASTATASAGSAKVGSAGVGAGRVLMVLPLVLSGMVLAL